MSKHLPDGPDAQHVQETIIVLYKAKSSKAPGNPAEGRKSCCSSFKRLVFQSGKPTVAILGHASFEHSFSCCKNWEVRDEHT